MLCARASLATFAMLLALLAACSDDPAPPPSPDMRPPEQPQDDTPEDQPPSDQPDETPDAPDETGAIAEGCNPIAYEHDCLLPFPSDFFLQPDATLPAGKRVVLTQAAQVPSRGGGSVNFYATSPADGFSPHMPILAVFPEGVDASTLSFHDADPAASIAATHPTLLLDVARGELVPHWAELDRNTTDPTRQGLILRTYRPLRFGARYVVAFQGLRTPQGEAIAPPQGFAQVRDGEAGEHPVLADLATRYEAEIFAPLTQAGVARDQLQLAWDFSVRTRQNTTDDMLTMRADLIAKLEATPPEVTVTREVIFQREDPAAALYNPQIAARVEGTLRVPLYLSDDQVGATIHRGPDGRPAANGTTEVPFTLQLPHSVIPDDAAFTPARMIQYGHGFFGLREEINYGFMRGFTQERAVAAAAVDWWGMSEPDQPDAAVRISRDISTTFIFTERLHQAMMNQIALTYALKGPLAQLPALRRFDKPVYDVEQVYYYGISQGHIFGGTFIPLSPQLDRAAFGVGGASYSFMMSRSANFAPFLALLGVALERDPLRLLKFIAMSQHTFDRVDPVVYSQHLLTSDLPNTPAQRQVLMQVGIGDAQVNKLTAHLHARLAQVPLVTPSPADVPLLETTTLPAPSGLVLVDFQLVEEPGLQNKAHTLSNEVHEGVRNEPMLREQVDQFLRPGGQLVQSCDGPCVIARPEE